MARALRLVLTICCMLFARTALANTCTTCYIDYQNGDDGNSGADKSHPWKHLPGMTGTSPAGASTGDACAGNCAAQVPAAGDRYILKGGVTWPSTVFPLKWTWSGSGTTSSFGCQGSGCIYVGYDSTWNLGQVNAVIPSRDLGGCSSGGVKATISGGGGSGATATATTLGGKPDFAGSQYLVAYYTVTSPGSGYTSNPTVSVSGAGCLGLQAVADIYRPIFDLGSGSSVTWTYSQTFPGLVGMRSVNYVIWDNIDIRNIMWTNASCNYTCDPVIFQLAQTPYATVSNMYIHNFFPATPHHSGGGDDGSHVLHETCNGMTCYDEASNNWVMDGEAAYTCPSGNGGSVCSFGGQGAVTGNYVHDNHLFMNNWQVSGSWNIYNNEVWGTVESSVGGHTNLFYDSAGDNTNTLIYNNLYYNNDAGSFSQMTQKTNANLYLFNNVCPSFCGNGSSFVIDPTQPNSGTWNVYIYNNSWNAGTGYCFNVGAGGANYAGMNLYLYNNQCITSQTNGHWYSANGPQPNTINGVSSPNNNTPDSANLVMTPSAASAAGYTQANRLQPTSSSSLTVTFSGKNMSPCNSAPAALCGDIIGNLRPSSGIPWNAGAYNFLGGSTFVAPPTGLVVTVN